MKSDEEPENKKEDEEDKESHQHYEGETEEKVTAQTQIATRIATSPS